MEQEKQVFSIDCGRAEIAVEIGQLAKQANGAVLVRYGDTAVLCTATASKERKMLDFFPLTVTMKKAFTPSEKFPADLSNGKEGRAKKPFWQAG